MNKIKLTLVMLVVAMSTSVFAQKTTKIGHINSNELLSAMPERTKIQKDLETYANDLRSTLETMRKEYEAKIKDFQSKQDVMTEVIKNSKIKEITDLEKRITEFQQTAEADLQKKEEELLQPVIDKAKEAINAVAKEGSYTLVLDSSVGVVLYSVEGDDILPAVKKKLGL
ncbi:MAG: OmpH family outer membrane protein [Flavobacteriales bacterium]|nr:OmpH family outer membrane protein [Flavobacteriales bacterium]